MLKKITALFAAASLLTTTANAEFVSVYINGAPVEFDQPPVIINDLTYVPFRAIFEEFGMVVQWNEAARCATAFNHDHKLSFIMDYDYIFHNDVGTPIPHGPVILNSRMLVPLRALAENIGGTVVWDGASQSVYITSDQATDDSNWEYEVLRLTNEIRSQYGLNELLPDAALAEVGRAHCMDMAARNYFSHSSPEGLSPSDRIHNAGIWPMCAGENIAAGQIDPQDVVTAWMDSPEHRENILEPSFTHMGAAMYRGGDYGTYWAQEFKGGQL